MSDYNKKRKSRVIIPVKQAPKPIIVKRDWADAVIDKKNIESVYVLKTLSEDLYKEDLIRPKILKHKNVSVMNRIPKNKENVDHEYWAYNYDKYLYDLYNIFCDGINQLEFESKMSLKSPEFLHIFSKFILQFSSGEISNYLEY